MVDEASIRERVAEVILAHAESEGPLLPMLHDIQASLGHIPGTAVPQLAEALHTTAAEVHGVVTFYHDFKRAPQGQHILKVCRAESCQAMGGAAMAEDLRARLGLEWGETTPDGRLTLEAVYCLGLCSCSPAAMLDGQLIGRAEADALAGLVAGLR